MKDVLVGVLRIGKTPLYPGMGTPTICAFCPTSNPLGAVVVMVTVVPDSVAPPFEAIVMMLQLGSVPNAELEMR